ncbi:MAG TPA: cytochrome c [Anaerolineales bacterium]|nr:cytochrome c [Anaerolineales bacterium]
MSRKLYLIFVLLFILAAFGSACGPSKPSYSDEQVANGEKLFMGTCSACHGPDGKGLPNLGKDVTNSAFVQEKTDEELLAYTKTGRAVDDPLNTTGIAMPPKGGNPALTDAQIMDIIAFVRSYYDGK